MKNCCNCVYWDRLITEEPCMRCKYNEYWEADEDKEEEIADSKPYEERPQGEWILVSERLPERYKEVIVTDIETKETYCSWYHGNGYWECDNGVLKNRIIAWQPLPEPYKKG